MRLEGGLSADVDPLGVVALDREADVTLVVLAVLRQVLEGGRNL